eukprot:747232-Hanusia_phi.AAC.4
MVLREMVGRHVLGCERVVRDLEVVAKRNLRSLNVRDCQAIVGFARRLRSEGFAGYSRMVNGLRHLEVKGHCAFRLRGALGVEGVHRHVGLLVVLLHLHGWNGRSILPKQSLDPHVNAVPVSTEDHVNDVGYCEPPSFPKGNLHIKSDTHDTRTPRTCPSLKNAQKSAMVMA